MATFPTLEPTTRALVLGDYPQLTYQGASGGEVRFKMATDRVSQRLTLGFEYLTEAEAQLILDHYETQQGSLLQFDLPSIVWSGYSTVPIPAADYEWRYAESFEVGVAAPLRYNISIVLESVAI